MTKRSGTQKRQRQHLMGFRVNDAERVEILQAVPAGQSVADYLRAAALTAARSAPEG